jgi:hypothetical protein
MKGGPSMIEPVPYLIQKQAVAPLAAAPGRTSQELWLSLARRSWRSAVLVPAEGRGTVAASAAGLAEVGRRLQLTPVTAVEAAELDYDGVAQLVRRIAALRLTHLGALPVPPEQLVVAIPSVLREPLGVAVAREADVVVLCLQLGRTSLAGARRTIEVIGLDRFAGCLLLT